MRYPTAPLLVALAAAPLLSAGSSTCPPGPTLVFSRDDGKGATVSLHVETDQLGRPARSPAPGYANSDLILTCTTAQGKHEARIERGSPGYGGTPVRAASPFPKELLLDEARSAVHLWCVETGSIARCYSYRIPELSLRAAFAAGSKDTPQNLLVRVGLFKQQFLVVWRDADRQTILLQALTWDGTSLGITECAPSANDVELVINGESASLLLDGRELDVRIDADRRDVHVAPKGR